MGIQLQLPAVNSQPVKVGNVYFHSGTGAFTIVAVGIDTSWAVGVGLNPPGPSGFSTDFPNAIELADADLVVGSNLVVV